MYVFFSDYHSAYFAEKTLNDVQLETLQAKMKVQWCTASEYEFISEYLLDKAGTPELSSRQISHPKFTCRYEIQILNDK